MGSTWDCIRFFWSQYFKRNALVIQYNFLKCRGEKVRKREGRPTFGNSCTMVELLIPSMTMQQNLDSLDGKFECRHHFVLLDSIWEGNEDRQQWFTRFALNLLYRILMLCFWALPPLIVFFFPMRVDLNYCGIQASCISHIVRTPMERYWTEMDGLLLEFGDGCSKWKEKMPSWGYWLTTWHDILRSAGLCFIRGTWGAWFRVDNWHRTSWLYPKNRRWRMQHTLIV